MEAQESFEGVVKAYCSAQFYGANLCVNIWRNEIGLENVDCPMPILQHEVRTVGEVQLEGSNASAEEMEEGTEEASESGVDLVLNHRLVETGFAKKNDYMAYLKDYMKKIVKYL